MQQRTDSRFYAELFCFDADEDLLKDLMTTGSELLQTVADKLNMKQVPGVQSWLQLAYHLGISHDVYREFDRTEPRKSPTTKVLQWLTARSPDITLIDVAKALNKIQRNDAIQIITEQFPDMVGKCKCHKDGLRHTSVPLVKMNLSRAHIG